MKAVVTEQNPIPLSVNRPGAELSAERAASAALQRDGTLAKMVASGILCLLLAFAWVFFVQLIEVLILWMLPPTATDLSLFFYLLRAGLLGLGLLLLILPVWLGRLRLAGLLLKDGDPALREVFHYFDTPRLYWRAVRIGAMLVIQALLPVLLTALAFGGAFALYDALRISEPKHVAVALLVIVLVFCVQLALVLILLSGVWLTFAALAVGNEQLPLSAALRRSLHCDRSLGFLFCFTLRWLWRLLLSFATLGVLFVLRYSHKYLLSYLHLSEVLCPKGEN